MSDIPSNFVYSGDERGRPYTWIGLATWDVVQDTTSGEYIAVKHGFSWPAFFFAPIWCLIKNLWLPSIAVAAILVLSYLMDHASLMVLAQTAIASVCGFYGNRWQHTRLRNKPQYSPLATVKAESARHAIKAVTQPDPRRALRSSSASLGTAILLPPIALLVLDHYLRNLAPIPAIAVSGGTAIVGALAYRHSSRTVGVVLFCWSTVILVLGLVDYY